QRRRDAEIGAENTHTLRAPRLCGELTLAQKFTRALITTVRLPPAVVMRPNVVELISVSGFPKTGRLSRLIASPRMTRSMPSWNRTRFIRFISKRNDPGPSRVVCDMAPSAPGEGFTAMRLPEESAMALSVLRCL